MNLNDTDTLKLVTSSTSALDVVVYFKDVGSNPSPKRSQKTAITSATTTTICAAPGAGTGREIESITIRNKGAASNTATLVVNDGTAYEGYEVAIGAEGHLLWQPAVGWTLTTPNTLGVANRTILQENVANALEVMAYADVTGLSFPVVADQTYAFRFVVAYTAAATTTGSAWAVNGPAAPTLLNVTSRYTLTATSQTVNYATAYDIPAAANATSLTAGNVAIVEGQITPSDDGTVILRCFSEETLSAITALAGSYVEWMRVL